MNAWLVSGEAAWRLAGWTMLHFLWVGAIVALVGAAMRVACRRAAPGVRYGVSLVTLTALAVAPVGIAIWLGGQATEDSGVVASPLATARDQRSRLYEGRVIDLARTPIVVNQNLQGADVPRSPAPGNEPTTFPQGTVVSFEAVAFWLPWVWLAGAPVTFALLATGLVGSRRLRRQCAAVTEGAAFEALERIKKLMRVTRRVALAACEHVAQPVLVGIVRPTILLPAAALTGWSPEQLEMVLVHELAHVRRWDNLVNLVQRLVESALFFHPAVWLASRQVRRDREECCDAAVVGCTRRPVEYAELLVSIAARGPRGRAQRAAKASLAFASAMADHPLAGRIRRILNLEDEPMWVSRSTIGLAFVLGASLLAAVLALPPTGGAVADDASTPPSPVAQTTDGGEEEAQDVPSAGQTVEAKTPRGNPSDAKKQAGAKRSDARRTHAGALSNFADYDLPKVKNDIAIYQSQLLQLHKAQEDIEIFKEKALQDARSSAVLEAAVAMEVRKDPTLAMHQQQLMQLDQAILEQSANRGPNSARFRQLQAQKQQTEAMRKHYQEQAEKAARERLAKVPNEALRAAMAEYQIRSKSIADRKAELEEKLQAAEARITEMAAGGGNYGRQTRRAATSYADAANEDLESAVVQEKIRTYQQALSAQLKEAADLEVQKQLAEMKAQRAGAIEARVQEKLELDRRAKIFEDEAISLEQQMRSLKGKLSETDESRLAQLKEQYQSLLDETDRYRQEATRKYRDQLAAAAQETLEASLMEYKVHAKALESRRAELVKELKEAEAQLAELANKTDRAAAEGGQNPYYYSPQPRLTGESRYWYSTPVAQAGQPAASAPAATTGESPIANPLAMNRSSGAAQSESPRAETSPFATQADEQPLGARTFNAPAQADPLFSSPDLFPQTGMPAAKRSLHPGDVIRVTASGVAPDQPLGDDFTVEAEGTLPLGPLYGRVKVAGLTVLEAQEAIERRLAKDWQNPRVQAVLADFNMNQPTLPASQGATLLYDGRTFEEWQRDWRNELKTEKRSAAIHALAAFGRAGMAEEAAEAILEVAGQYDFYTVDNQSSEGQFKRAVIDLLTSTTSSRLRESAWMPALVRRLEADPARWKWLAWNLISSLFTDDAKVREQLFALAASKDADIRSAALSALANSDPSRTNAKVIETITQLVRSSDAEEVKTGINMLLYSPKLPGGRWTPPRVRNAADIAPHFFHEDESVRQTARETLNLASAADARPIVAELMKRLKDSEDEATKLAAIRGLAAIGPNAADAETVMRDFITGTDAKLAAAAAVALDRMHPDASLGTKALTDHLSGVPGGLTPYDDQTLERERAALFTPRENQGGGGFGGGGGRGGF